MTVFRGFEGRREERVLIYTCAPLYAVADVE
jgi:hypothetical protein